MGVLRALEELGVVVDMVCGTSASVSIPGVLPPVPYHGDLLVDGCVLNNLPINVMRTMNPSGVLIASHVVSPRGLRAKSDYGLSLSGWSQLLQRFTPWRKTVPTPGVATVILQSTMVGSEQTRKRVLAQRLADFCQNIHVQGIGMLQFDSVARASKVGYEAVREPLAEWARPPASPQAP